MSPVSPIVLALGLLMMPVSVAAQTGEGARSSTTSSETTVSVKSLLDAKVLDSTNREMGTV